jgi:hypothetical protein
MKRMKLLLFFLASLACAAELEGVHKVYLMPMSRGMDQYLANRLVGEHVFVVVTDPKLADAVFTDRLGEIFQTQWDELAAPKNPEPVAKAAVQPASSTPASMISNTANKIDNPALNSSFGRSRGTLFLWNPKSHVVVWATYDPPKDGTGKELDHTASDIVTRLKKVLNEKKKEAQ